jgi:hypothetical protein
MTLTKINEQYSLKDTTENNWNVEGTVTYTVEDNLSYNINVNNEEEHIGSMSYHKPVIGGTSISYHITDSYEDSFIAYTNTLTDNITEYFKK